MAASALNPAVRLKLHWPVELPLEIGEEQHGRCFEPCLVKCRLLAVEQIREEFRADVTIE
jgi:hypothetical protein